MELERHRSRAHAMLRKAIVHLLDAALTATFERLSELTLVLGVSLPLTGQLLYETQILPQLNQARSKHDPFGGSC